MAGHSNARKDKRKGHFEGLALGGSMPLAVVQAASSCRAKRLAGLSPCCGEECCAVERGVLDAIQRLWLAIVAVALRRGILGWRVFLCLGGDELHHGRDARLDGAH